uniref:Ankyrin repeat domain 13D n=1 Tax=Rousettus aegyptiacus TaxID=9407 RepID=A0A7J8GVD9_ROUAE|nr:ankyrin repeat domain 13D [Rousettus aegyptiacus]
MAGPGPTFPLHRLVWANRHRELEAALHSRQHDIEQEDPRGRTPLELAVSLGNLESVRVLLRHNANVGKESCQGWAVLQEAVSTGDPEMVQLVLQYRDYQRATQRLAGIPELLNKLRQCPWCPRCARATCTVCGSGVRACAWTLVSWASST